MAQDAIWSAFGAPFGWLLGRILALRCAKMAPSWPTWRQDVPKMANLEAKMANLAHFGSILETFFGSWVRSCQKWRKPKNDDGRALLKVFFEVLGLLLEALLAHLGAMLGYVEPSGHHLGATWRQDGA